MIRTEWNAAIVDELFAGCKKILESGKIEWQDYRVPGAFEIPFAIKKYWNQAGKKNQMHLLHWGALSKEIRLILSMFADR